MYTTFVQNGITYSLLNHNDYIYYDRRAITVFRATLCTNKLLSNALQWNIVHTPNFDYNNYWLYMLPTGNSVYLYDISFEIIAYYNLPVSFYGANEETVIYFVGYFW